MIYSEQRLDISFITGEEGAQGTADVVITKPGEIIVIDLKYGMGVKVDAEDNEQLLIYGWAAFKEFDLTGDIKTLRLVISQPRLNHVSEWVLTVEQAEELINELNVKAKRILTAKGGDLSATPGTKQCKFCKVKAGCPEYRNLTLETITNTTQLIENDNFLNKIENAQTQITLTDDTTLANCMDALELIENWCVGIRKEVEKRLQNDNFTDHRWKLVQGKTGNRKISNIDDILDIAKEHNITENYLYEKEILSPAQLEKIHKKDNPLFWAKIQPLMTRAEGRPVVVPSCDKRPALNLTLDFKPIDEECIGALIGLAPERRK